MHPQTSMNKSARARTCAQAPGLWEGLLGAAELLDWAEWQEPYFLLHQKSISELQGSFGFPCGRRARKAPQAQSWTGPELRPEEAQTASGHTLRGCGSPAEEDSGLHSPSTPVWLKGRAVCVRLPSHLKWCAVEMRRGLKSGATQVLYNFVYDLWALFKAKDTNSIQSKLGVNMNSY